MADTVDKGLRKAGIIVSRPVLAVLCIIFGILLIIFPYLTGYIIGIFLIIEGILFLTDYMEKRDRPAAQTRAEPPPPPPPPPTSTQEPPETPPAAPPTELAQTTSV